MRDERTPRDVCGEAELRANGGNNSQHCWTNDVAGCCLSVGSGVETDAATPQTIPQEQQSEATRGGEREKSPRRVSPFLAWGDFHAHSRFARFTFPEEKWGTTRSLTTPNNTQQHATGCANGRNM